jgi:1-deoxy-D-xylulose-5-phosphate reductoisomerase
VKRVAVFGATGSIGASLIDIVRRNRERYELALLSAHQSVEKLAALASEFGVRRLHLFDDTEARRLANEANGAEIYASHHSIAAAIAASNCDLVVNAIVGAAGLEVSYHALSQGKNLALANKESMVAGGKLLRAVAAQTGAQIIPIDSEHSALFQCLLAGRHEEIEKLVLTSSGGPFRARPAETFEAITVAEALRHPNWSMGAKITVDSATLMNKGLEVIEAHFLFDIAADDIEVVVHPQSIVHSLVQFCDGATLAQLSPPDMRLPIAYALEYPRRLPTDLPRLNLPELRQLTFESPDHERFPCLRLAYQALRDGGMAPLALNAANEIAVAAFLCGSIKFIDIPIIVEEALSALPTGDVNVLADLLAADQEARRRAEAAVKHGTFVTGKR